MANHIYEVVRPLIHGGLRYAPGDTVTMSEREARFLQAGGQLKRWRRPEKKTKKRSSKKKKASPEASAEKQAAPEVVAEAVGQTIIQEESDG